MAQKQRFAFNADYVESCRSFKTLRCPTRIQTTASRVSERVLQTTGTEEKQASNLRTTFFRRSRESCVSSDDAAADGQNSQRTVTTMMSRVLDSLDRISSSNLRAGDLEVGEVVFKCGALDCCPINAARSNAARSNVAGSNVAGANLECCSGLVARLSVHSGRGSGGIIRIRPLPISESRPRWLLDSESEGRG